MTDTELINWLEQVHGQLWHNKDNNTWTCQVIHYHTVIQPSRETIRAVIADAHAAWKPWSLQHES
jgi:hypothetical protein